MPHYEALIAETVPLFKTLMKKSLEALHQSGAPQKLREDMFSKAKPYAISLLTTDIGHIYQFANLPKPSMDQVKLISKDTSVQVSKHKVNEVAKSDTNNKATVDEHKSVEEVFPVILASEEPSTTKDEENQKSVPSSPKPTDFAKPGDPIVKDDKQNDSSKFDQQSKEVNHGFQKLLSHTDKDGNNMAAVSPSSISMLMMVETSDKNRMVKETQKNAQMVDSTVIYLEETPVSPEKNAPSHEIKVLENHPAPSVDQQPDTKSADLVHPIFLPVSESPVATPVVVMVAETVPKESSPGKAREQPSPGKGKGRVRIVYALVDRSEGLVPHVEKFLATKGKQMKRKKVKIIMAPGVNAS